MYTAAVLILTLSTTVSCTSEPDAEFRNIDRLRRDLRIHYQRNSRPVKHHETTVNIEIAFVGVLLTNVDASQGSVTLTGLIVMRWTDEHLRWDQSVYGGIHEVSFSSYDIWTPDLLHWNAITNKPTVSYDIDRTNIVVMPNGTVYWTPSFKVTSSCNLDLTEFPSDKQRCVIYFGMWVSTLKEVKLHAGLQSYKNIDWPMTTHVVEPTEWTYLDHSITEINATELSGTTYSGIALDITIQRNSDMLHFLVRVPYYLASVTQVAIFFLTAIPSTERISLTVFALMLLYSESLMVNNVLIPGFPGLRVPYVIKCLELNALEIAFNLIISQVAFKFIMNMQILKLVEDRITAMTDIICRYRVTEFICCRLFHVNMGSILDENGCVPGQNSLTSGIHDLAEGLTEHETDRDDVVIAGRLSGPAASDKKTARTVLLLIDRGLLLQYLIFLMIFHP